MKVIFSTVVAEVFCSESRWLLRTDQAMLTNYMKSSKNKICYLKWKTDLFLIKVVPRSNSSLVENGSFYF